MRPAPKAQNRLKPPGRGQSAQIANAVLRAARAARGLPGSFGYGNDADFNFVAQSGVHAQMHAQLGDPIVAWMSVAV
jgi:hypothetical protein